MQYELGKQAISSGAAYVNTQLDKVDYKKLRRYFAIDDSYLREKLFLIIYPFKSKDDRVYRPDLYIPVISMATLILIKSLIHGLSRTFHPEKLCLSFTRTILIHFIISVFYRIVAYVLRIHLSYLDILSTTGYKFFNVIIFKVIFPYIIGKVLIVYLLVSFFVFLSRSFKYLSLKEGQERSVVYFIFGISGLEAFLCLVFAYL